MKMIHLATIISMYFLCCLAQAGDDETLKEFENLTLKYNTCLQISVFKDDNGVQLDLIGIVWGDKERCDLYTKTDGMVFFEVSGLADRFKRPKLFYLFTNIDHIGKSRGHFLLGANKQWITTFFSSKHDRHLKITLDQLQKLGRQRNEMRQ